MPNGTFQAVLKLSGQLRRLLVGLYVYAIQTGTGLLFVMDLSNKRTNILGGEGVGILIYT